MELSYPEGHFLPLKKLCGLLQPQNKQGHIHEYIYQILLYIDGIIK